MTSERQPADGRSTHARPLETFAPANSRRAFDVVIAAGTTVARPHLLLHDPARVAPWSLNKDKPVVKVCGIQTAETAHAVAQVGADMIGVNFAHVSKRRITRAVARGIVHVLRSVGGPTTVNPRLLGVRLDFGDASQESLGEAKIPRPRVVGVFVDQTAEEIASVASEVGLDAVQLSGECSPTACRSAFEATGLPVIAVMRLGGSVDATTAWAQELAETQGVAAVLVDAPGTVGGAGHPWDHSQARRIVQSTAVVGVPVIVAGGLHAGNVAGALVSTGAWGADVASGVETDGMTDPTRVRAFIAAARGSNRNETAPTAHKPQREA